MLAIVDVWMVTAFEGGRHRRRVDLIDGDRTG
jgi:ribose 5-phosphate isomerase RpiB